VAQVIAGDFVVAQVAAALEKQHPLAGLGEDAGGDAAAKARADNDDVIVSGMAWVYGAGCSGRRGSYPTMRQETASRLPPFCGSA